MITIIGDFDKKNYKLVIVILSKKNYYNSEIFVNNKKKINIDIKKYKITRIILDLESEEICNLTIKIFNNSKLIEIIDGLNLTEIFNNILIVNCDSTLGLEKNMWDKIKDIKSNYIIHCGDQIYNDKLFKKYFRFIDIDKQINIKKLKIDIYNNYYNQFYRYKNILKNNLNLMIPDDHEIVDDIFGDKYKNNEKFVKINNIFQKFVTNIELELKNNSDEIHYLKDEVNKIIYVLNYTTEFDNNILNKYDFDTNIEPFNKIILISRKSLLSSKNNIFNRIIFSQDPLTLVNIDILLKKIIKNNKKMYIFCGDDHSYKKSIIKYKNKNICEIITCGSINTVPELFRNKIILNTNIKELQLKNISNDLINSFIKLKIEKEKIKIMKISEKKNMLYYLIDNLINFYNLL